MMMNILRLFIVLTAVSLSLVPPGFATGDQNEKFDPLHHTEDGAYLDFSPFGKVYLPQLLVVRTAEGSLALRMFTAAADNKHGETAAAEDAGQQETTVIDEEAHGEEETVLIDISITRHFVFALLASGILLAVFLTLARRYRPRNDGRHTAPKGIFQNLFESLILFIRDDVARPNLGEKYYKKFLPFLLTVFFFILACNLLGLVPFGATATSNLTVTAVLATCTFGLTQFHGSRAYWRHIFWPPGVPVLVKLLLIPTEILGIFAKPFALAIRLFANMTAGHLVILSLLGIVFTFANLFGPVAGYSVIPVSLAFALFVGLLEVLIALIQAYIFTFLSALFIGLAIADHAHDDSHDVHPPTEASQLG